MVIGECTITRDEIAEQSIVTELKLDIEGHKMEIESMEKQIKEYNK